MKRLLLLSLVVVAFSTAVGAGKRNITEKDLFNFVWIGDTQVSPDGSRVAFVRVTVNEKKEGYNTSIWAVSTSGNEVPHRLTSGERDSSPRWSPDGKYLVFTRATEKDGKPESPQLFMLSMAGGDAFPFTTLPKGAGDPRWSPDGKTIAFTSTTNPEDLAKQEKKKRKEEELKQAHSAEASPPAGKEKKKTPDATAKQAETEAERESDVHVVTRAVYRGDDEGYYDFKRPQHIWIVSAPRNADEKVQPKQLTSGRFDEGGVVWSKDGAQIYFASLHNDEPYYETAKTELYSIPVAGGEPTKLMTIDMDTGAFALSPDGKQIAFIASATKPVNSYTQPDLVGDRSGQRRKAAKSHRRLRLGCRRERVRRQWSAARRRRQRSDLGAGRQEHRREFREGRTNESRLVRCRDRRSHRNHERKSSHRAVSRRA